MSMIPERYREQVPPYWYENKAALYHYESGGGETEFQRAKKMDLDRQMSITTATWGLVFWEYMFQVKAKLGDSYETRRARVIAKYRERNPFTPALGRSITKLFVTQKGEERIQITEEPDTGFFYIAVPLDTVYDIASWVQDIHKRKRVPHVFMPQLVVEAGVVIDEMVFVRQRRYHMVKEFRVGMTPMKYQNEVMI
ncbi:putative phage tail protein [Brevibacillus daliensis]|uniref:putative phage tail protein n=1 Tax=Brevibacillus daliensis TaxID=2892995 RepID=UPI001E4C4828|nr:putative phage tail protein [Brevibacillus daliensis]